MQFTNKKRLRLESSDPLSALFSAVKQPANLDSTTVQQRNVCVVKQFSDKHLRSIDVVGDGNCLYRAISLSVYGSQSEHGELHKAIASHMLDKSPAIFDTGGLSPSDVVNLRNHAHFLLRNGEWGGEEVLVTAADFLQRNIKVYSIAGMPNVYSPVTGPACHQPISLAFYESGHYHSVSLIHLNT